MNNELTLNRWLRKPKSTNTASMSTIQKTRDDVFNAESDSFKKTVDKLKRDIEDIDNIKSLEQLLLKFNVDVNDVVADPDAFELSIENDDIDSALSQVSIGLDKWADDSIKQSHDTNDFYSLSGHPNKRVMGGGPSLKRSMGY